MSTRKNLIFFLCMTGMLAMLCTGCGKKEEAGQPADTNRVKAEESTEVQEPAIEETTAVVEESTEEMVVEEEQVEDDTANLSNEQWVESLNLQTGTFLIFNDITGERKVLEDGQEYTLLEGDQLAFWWPLDWLLFKDDITLYTDEDLKYTCRVYNLNLNVISDKTKFYAQCTDENEQKITTIVYLSK